MARHASPAWTDKLARVERPFTTTAIEHTAPAVNHPANLPGAAATPPGKVAGSPKLITMAVDHRANCELTAPLNKQDEADCRCRENRQGDRAGGHRAEAEQHAGGAKQPEMTREAFARAPGVRDEQQQDQ